MNNICHIVQSYYPRDPRIRRQAEALAEAGHCVDVVCLRGENESAREIVNGVNVIRLPLTRKRGSALRYVYEYMAFFTMAWFHMFFSLSKHYQLIHVSNMPDVLVFSAMPAKWFGSIVLLDEHDPMPELFMAKYGAAENSLLIRYLKWQERISLHFANHVLTVNDAMKERYEPRANPVPVSVVMNLPEDKLFQPAVDRTDVHDKFTLIYTGTVTKFYNLPLVVEAVANLRTKIPNIYFKIVGDGDDISTIKDLIEKLNVSDFVELCGKMPYYEISDLVGQSDLGISTLTNAVHIDMCFYTKTAEYAMMGLPSIATRSKAVESYFPKCVIRYVEPEDLESLETAIFELYNNPETRKEMSRNGIEFSKTSNWSVEKKRYLELINNLCR